MDGECVDVSKSEERDSRGGADLRPARIVLFNADTEKHQYELENDETVLGRGVTADIQINAPSVSREHARIHRHTGGRELYFTLTDMGSSNGTKVNGVFTTDTRLQSGDEIQLGEVKLKFYR